MAASANPDPSRKPSSSSSRSATHSPSSSPGNPHPSRRLTPNQTGAMLGVGMASSRQLKGFGPGWPASQVWSGASKRNVSGSTATSIAERSSQGDSGYRSMSEGGWRPSTVGWEEAGSGTGFEDPAQFPSVRARPSIPTSPSGGRVVSRGSPNVVDTDLARSFRGMAVEADFTQANLIPGQQMPGAHAGGRSPVQRSPRHGGALPPQGPYPPAVFPQTDYSLYQGSLPTREPYQEHPFPYEPYRSVADPAVYAASPAMTSGAPIFPPAGGFYDFSAPAVHPGGFYYPSPMQHPQMAPPTMMYPSPMTTSPRLARPVDYGAQLPMMVAGSTMYPSLNPPAIFPPTRAPHDHRHVQQHQQPVYASSQLRSAVLDDFRLNKSRRWELRDILGHAVEFAADQHGSRFMQHRYEAAAADVKQAIFDEVVPTYVQRLVQDVFGNYVIQKMFEHGTATHRAQLVAAMEGSVLAAALQMYGCRVIQKALDYVTPEQQSVLVKELDPHIMRCVKDANGNHVVQKMIERVPVERLTFIKSFHGCVYELASHPYGCRVLQRCLEKLGSSATRPLLDELQKYATELMQDQFGNYVVQFLLENGEPQDRAAVVGKLHGQMLAMARHKFASNVVEKALVTADSDNRRSLIQELITQQHDGTSPIVIMMKDQYANYVLQRALAVAEGPQQQELAALVRPQLAAMRRVSSVYTKHLSSIERCLNKIQ